jgi:hypothetical protein
MLDLPARRHLAQGLRWLATGRITNREFESRFAKAVQRSKDPGVRDVYGAAWGLYSDLETHRLTGVWHLDRKARHDVARCILFLRSIRPYEWPVSPLWVSLAMLPLHIVTLGMTARIQNRRWRASGEYSVWPFRRRRDYRAALREPVYLKPQR